MADMTGQQLGDYRIVESIGAGGMGQVYLAEHVHLRKRYALKVLPAELAADRGFVARFYDEARVMADLRHPGIVQVHQMSQNEGGQGEYFLVMDYVVGPDGEPRTLQEHIKGFPGQRLLPDQVRALAIQIAEALAYAHAKGVVHRDIKPANVLLDDEGNAKLADFGLAKAVGQEFIASQIHQTIKQTLSGRKTIFGNDPATPRRGDGVYQDTLDVGDTVGSGKTPSGRGPSGRASSGESILGTYDYMAPEQRGEGGGAIDQRTDIYAFGVLLYRLLTGKRPVGLAMGPS